MKHAGLLAALAITAGMGAAAQAMPSPRKGSARDYKPRRIATTQPDDALAQEIAEHNRQVEYRKAEKRARKAWRQEQGR
jgi:hypothetical protein